MQNHTLDITYHNTYNCKTLRIEDNSVYDASHPVKNAILEVKSPGLLSFVPFYFPNGKWKSITLNCSSLKICCGKKVSTLSTLPDGIYEIKYSIDPNLDCMVEFNHMRICQIMTILIKLIGKFFANRCCLTHREQEELEKELMSIKDMIDASVYAVEESLDNSLGLKLYHEALARLTKIDDDDIKCGCR